jgi:hypothetical protein
MKKRSYLFLIGAMALLLASMALFWLNQSTPALTQQQLYNLSYPLHGFVANLKQGRYEAGDKPNEDGYSRAKITHYAIGDLDRDGDGDAATIIIDDDGMIGSLVYLSIVENRHQKPVAQPEPLILGDRISISDLTIKDNRITVTIATEAAFDGAEGNVLIPLQFELKEGELQEINLNDSLQSITME